MGAGASYRREPDDRGARWWRDRRASRRPARSARARWWSPVTTPARRRAALAERGGLAAAGRAVAAARAPATHAIRSYRLLLGGPLGERDRAGRRVRPPDPVPAGARGCSARDDVEVWPSDRRRWAATGPSRSTRHLRPRRGRRRPTTTAWLERWREADARVGRDARRAARRRARPHAVRRRRRGRARPSRPAACSSSARRARSATST